MRERKGTVNWGRSSKRGFKGNNFRSKIMSDRKKTKIKVFGSKGGGGGGGSFNDPSQVGSRKRKCSPLVNYENSYHWGKGKHLRRGIGQ